MYKLIEKRGEIIFSSFKELNDYLKLWEVVDFKIVKIKGQKMRESQKKFISLVYREQKIKTDYLMSNKKNWLDTKEQNLLLNKTGYKVTNKHRGKVEAILFKNLKSFDINTNTFIKDNMDNYFAYVDEDKKIITTFNGDKLGDILYRKINNTKDFLIVYGINGLKYNGYYYKKSGDYCRLKIKGQKMKIIENLINCTDIKVLLKAYKSQKRYLYWLDVNSDLCFNHCCDYKGIKFSDLIMIGNKYFLDISTCGAKDYIKKVLEDRAKQIANNFTKVCYYYSDFKAYLKECHGGLSEAGYREILRGLK